MGNFATYPSLKDKSVIVSGGASGIGAAMVEAFAAQGARVGFVDFDRDAGNRLAAQTPGEVAFEFCDLRDVDMQKSAFAKLRDRTGPAHALINNAARDDRHDWRDVSVEFWDERMATNLRHMFFGIQCVADDMIAAGGGSIVNMGSISWMMPQGGFPAYTTGKAAVHGLTRTMARELGAHGIRVNTIAPGWIMTDRQKELWLTPDAEEAHLDRQCLKTMIDPAYVAQMAVFLASDDAAMCTAQNFFVEAGAI